MGSKRGRDLFFDRSIGRILDKLKGRNSNRTCTSIDWKRSGCDRSLEMETYSLFEFSIAWGGGTVVRSPSASGTRCVDAAMRRAEPVHDRTCSIGT